MKPHLTSYRLMTAMTLLAAGLATVADAQDNGATSTGPCAEPVPCTPRQKLGDPDDCQIFYKCDVTGSGYTQQSCPEGQQFDFRKLKCRDPARVSKVKCTPSCKKQARLREKAAATTPPPENRNFRNEPNQRETVTERQTPSTVPMTEAVTTAPIPVDPIGDLVVGDVTTQNVMATTTVEVVSMEKTTAAAMAATTMAADTPAPPVVVVPSESHKPPYVIVTEAPVDDDVTGGGGIVGESGDVTEGGAAGGAGINPVIIGAAVGGLVVIIIIIIVIIVLLRRRKFRKDRDIEKLENPQYSTVPTNSKYRFSTDSTLYVGPTVNLRQANNNAAADNSGLNSEERKKRQAPGAPTPTKEKKDKGKDKRRAPPPPNPFTGEVDGLDRPVTDLYEKDSQHSGDEMEMSTFTAKSDGGAPEEAETEKEPAASDPLLRNSTDSGRAVSGSAPFDDIPDIDDSSSGDDYDKAKNPFAFDD